MILFSGLVINTRIHTILGPRASTRGQVNTDTLPHTHLRGWTHTHTTLLKPSKALTFEKSEAIFQQPPKWCLSRTTRRPRERRRLRRGRRQERRFPRGLKVRPSKTSAKIFHHLQLRGAGGGCILSVYLVLLQMNTYFRQEKSYWLVSTSMHSLKRSPWFVGKNVYLVITNLPFWREHQTIS